MTERRTTNRFTTLFDEAAHRNAILFVAALRFGDPSPETSLRIVETLLARGADALELELPFSDPSDCTPSEAVSAHRALCAGTTTARTLHAIRQIRAAHPETPIALAIHANQAVAPGVERFFEALAEAGADALRIIDLPAVMREKDPTFDEAAERTGILLTDGLSAALDAEHLIRSAARAAGYTSLRVGSVPDAALRTAMETLKTNGAAPVLLRFERLTPEKAALARALGSAGVISGTETAERIGDLFDAPQALETAFADYAASVRDVCRG